jgi:hypothetical protein
MELTFRLTREDYGQFAKLGWARVADRAKRVSGWRGNPAVFFLASASLPALVIAALYLDRHIGEAGAIVAALAYAWGLLSMSACNQYWQRQLLRHCWPDDSPALGEIRLRLTGEGIETTKTGRKSRYLWQAFSACAQSGDLLVLWLDRQEAILVPSRAFASEQARQAFLESVGANLPPAPAAGGGRA